MGKSVRKLSPPNVSRSPPRQDTAQELLVMTPRLSLLELLLPLSELFHMVVSPLDMDHPMDLMEALHTAKGKLRQMQSLRLRLKVPTMVTHPAFRSQLPFVRAFHKRCATTFPLTNPKVKNVVCKTVVDIEIIEDCKEVVTTHCEQTSQKVSHHSSVVGHDTRVGPAAVVDSYAVGHSHGLGAIRRFGGYGKY